MDYSRAALADLLAAEYVCGVLRGPARRRFEALLPAHPALRGAVRGWQDRLMPLTEVIEPLQPSTAVWTRVEERIHGASGASTAAGAVAPSPSRGSLWRQLAFWRGLSAFAGICALTLAMLLANPAPVRPPIVVVLSAASPSAGAAGEGAVPASFVASITADGRAMVTKPLVKVSMEPNHSLELWSLPPSGAPRSLGVIAPDKATVVQRDKVLEGTDAFAVTLEPAGGAPNGKPTGPVLYLGKLVL